MNRKFPNGFSLFEVLIALGIFSIAVVGLMFAFNSALDAARQIRFEAAVRQAIESRIAELEGMELTDYEQVIESTIPGVEIRESIFRDTVVNEEKTVLSGFWKISIEARWERDGETQTMEAQFLRYGL